MMRFRRLVWLTSSLVLALAAPARPDGFVSKTDVFASAADFAHAATEGARYDARLGGFRLIDAPGGYGASGTITLDQLRHHAGFDTVVASWNADCPAGTWLKAELSASFDDGASWTAWYELARWGDAALLDAQPRAGRHKADADGKVDADTLALKRRATRLRYRLTLHSERPDVTPLLTLAAVSVVDAKRPVPPDDTPHAAWGKEIAASFRSQSQLPSDVSYRGCGPTAAAMALSAYGLSLPPQHVARACWDAENALYGNWAFIAAGASALMRQGEASLKAAPSRRKVHRSYVAWYPDWKGVEAEIAQGNPVIASIYFGPGELKGSMTPASDGHLLLVRGFTKRGDVICSDPAARTEKQGRVVYDRRQLHRARHGGPVIVFRPHE